MANGPDHQQVHMEVTQELEVSLSCHTFTRNFSQAVHALLTSCTRQEVLGYFAHLEPRTQEYLYKAYCLVVAQIRENVILEFGSICKEHQVLEVLDHVSDRSFISATEVGDIVQPEKIAREVAVRRKSLEVDEMRKKLEQVKEENKALEAQLELFRLDMAKARDQGSLNNLTEKVSTDSLHEKRKGEQAKALKLVYVHDLMSTNLFYRCATSTLNSFLLPREKPRSKVATLERGAMQLPFQFTSCIHSFIHSSIHSLIHISLIGVGKYFSNVSSLVFNLVDDLPYFEIVYRCNCDGNNIGKRLLQGYCFISFSGG